jgi:hypothetical protein
MTRDLAPCGTSAAARRHRRRGEPACEACLQAERLRIAQQRGGTAPSSLSIDRRHVRNGLPEFRPYVYRGTGDDIYGAAS